LVLIPKGKYKGQKLINEVKTKMLLTIKNTNAVVPVITSVINNILMTAAMTNLINLSAIPMFFFIFYDLNKTLKIDGIYGINE
jgi:hypothetical protein